MTTMAMTEPPLKRLFDRLDFAPQPKRMELQIVQERWEAARGGRPDLAGDALRRVQAPTLLIVGGLDYGVIELNRSAQQLLRCRNRLDIVPGATHLFEEPGTLESVVERATKWFIEYLGATRDATDD